MQKLAPLQNVRINVVIPAYNEQNAIGEVLASLITKKWINQIIVVDDKSTDNTVAIVKQFPVTLLRNKTNQGSGFSTIKGLQYSRSLKNAQYTATVDADGQHTVQDLFLVYKEIRKNYKKGLIFHANRRILSDAPFSKRFFSQLAWIVLSVLYGKIIEDPFCGLNIYNHDVIPLLKFSKGYDWPINLLTFLQQIRKNVILKQVPARYSEYSLSKGMTFKTSTIVFLKIIAARIKELLYEKNTSSNKSLIPTNWWD